MDLVEHRDMVGLETETLVKRMRNAVAEGRLDREALRKTAEEFGTRKTRKVVEDALGSAAEAA